MRLSIRHRTKYTYEPPAIGLGLRLKMFATSTPSQRVISWTLDVDGEPITPLLTNGFGEGEALVMPPQAIETLEITAEGVVETIDKAGVLGKLGHVRPQVFLRRTALTKPCEAIVAIGQEAMETGSDTLGRMHALAAIIGKAIDYRKGATEADTTASQALAIGGGVCQDFAHVFISAARAVGIPARYVVGYLLDDEEPLSETHGWAEAHIDGLGWVGFDPVHQLCPTDAYVRLTAGFDAVDAAPIRGTLSAGSEEDLDVEVAITQFQAQQQ